MVVGSFMFAGWHGFPDHRLDHTHASNQALLIPSYVVLVSPLSLDDDPDKAPRWMWLQSITFLWAAGATGAQSDFSMNLGDASPWPLAVVYSFQIVFRAVCWRTDVMSFLQWSRCAATAGIYRFLLPLLRRP